MVEGSYAAQYASNRGFPHVVSAAVDADGNAVSLWKVILADGEAFIDGYEGKLYGDLILPDEIDGVPVAGIGDLAFEGRGFDNLVIPDSVRQIGSYAFFENSYMSEVTIPAGVTSMGWNPFARCALKTIRVDPANPVYVAKNGVLFDDEQKLLVAYPNEKKGEYTIPKGTLYIGESAFEWSDNITGVAIPGSVTVIGDRAFYMCQSLASVTIAKGVTEIGDSAFYDCRRLKAVTIPGSCLRIGDSAFFVCGRLQTVTLQMGVEYIGDMAFMHCDKLTKVTIPDSVMSIGDYAFSGCESLKSLSIPTSVTYIGEDAFDNFHDDLILSVRQGSYAEQYAIDNEIPYVLAAK